MVSFCEELSGKSFVKGEDLEEESLIVAQKILVGLGLVFLPNSYTEFLKHYNGIKNNGSYIFGASVDEDLDIVDKNKQMQKPQNSVLLGCNDLDLLVYNYAEKKYQIVDRTDFEVLEEYDEQNPDSALRSIFVE